MLRSVSVTTSFMAAPTLYKFKTAVYNKRSEAVYKDLPMVVYPQKDTMLAAQCKFGIVYPQAHRFVRRCTFRSDFDSAVKELVVYLIDVKGYPYSACIKQLKKFCTRYKHKFGLQSGRKSLKYITEQVQLLTHK